MSGFDYRKDADGIVTVTMDMAGPVNSINADYPDLLEDVVERLEHEDKLKGLILASAKKTFFAGGDLNTLLLTPKGSEEAFFRDLERSKSLLRRIEKLPVPVVVAINGAALGGGYEICLACNYRVIVSDPAAVVGLPEVTLGLLPGAGGIVRLVHMLGIEKALPHLLEGTRSKPTAALAAGLVDEIVEDRDFLLPRARAWILENPGAAAQPWDVKGHKVPGGSGVDVRIMQFVQLATVTLANKTRGLLPAPARVLAVASEATIVDFDTALRIESRGLASLVTTPEAKNIITTNFFQMNQVKRGANRPAGIPPSRVARLGVLGAGMMGQGIAYVAARAGIPVMLKDVTINAAEAGKAYSQKLLDAQVAKGKLNADERDRILGLIRPTATVEDLAGCDLIIEAVFENVALKEKVTGEAELQLSAAGIFASNTSTLPISMLARASSRPENFVGIHFFSPVDKMPLVEIIRGEETSEATLARAFDFAKQIGKISIVVNDSVGFFTSRVFGTYMDEGARLLNEGVDPVAIENLARQIGMPVGPLAVQDEVSQELTHKAAETQRALGLYGTKGDFSASADLSTILVEDHGRGGRHHGGGYYEYADDGKRIWPKLRELFGSNSVDMLPQDIKDRLLFRQVIESIKCLEEGVLGSVADGNVGSLLGIGAPAWTGGFLQFVNTYGLDAFRERALELAALYGARFEPPALLVEKAARADAFA